MSDRKEKLGYFPFVVGGMAYIPLVGVLFGAAAIIWGVLKRKQGGTKLALIGVGGIFFTLSLYSGLFLFGQAMRGQENGFLKSVFPNIALNQLVQVIEVYKIQQGGYPKSLEDLEKVIPEKSRSLLEDPRVGSAGETRSYYYELVDSEHYYLLGVGEDGKPFTEDDDMPSSYLFFLGGAGLLAK